MDFKRNILTAIALVLLINAPVMAQSDNQAPMTVSDLDAILQDEILLKAKANREKQRVELSRYNSSAQTPSLSNRSLPQLAWRRLTASGWLAKLIFDDGASLIASEGEHLPGGYSVAQINDHGVKLKLDGELIDLTAVASGPRTANAPQLAHTPAGSLLAPNQ